MRILIIRHGDPDYENDCLTERGKKEAESLSKYLEGQKIDYFYMSPLGRAMETASYTLKRFGKQAEILPWAREFHAPITIGGESPHIPWDWLPEQWTAEKRYFDRDSWFLTDVMQNGNVISEARRVWYGLDELLKKHGYERIDDHYKVNAPNSDTIALFCHFGVECVMLAHLLGVSPMTLWHGCCALTTSVTELYTEERRKGKAYFRIIRFGNTEHLTIDGIKPSFSGRFCEMYDNTDERHD